jgi:hypothetical protein
MSAHAYIKGVLFVCSFWTAVANPVLVRFFFKVT